MFGADCVLCTHPRNNYGTIDQKQKKKKTLLHPPDIFLPTHHE